jgi:predicted nucleotidyltransferase component of viral defense system
VELWGHTLLVDTVEEIIAKKIYYRGDKGNARDLFDISIAFHKEPDILTRMKLDKKKIITLFNTVSNIYSNQELRDLYIEEIKQMNPNSDYEFLAINTINYLYSFLENICASYTLAYELLKEEYTEIEDFVFKALI